MHSFLHHTLYYRNKPFLIAAIAAIAAAAQMQPQNLEFLRQAVDLIDQRSIFRRK